MPIFDYQCTVCQHRIDILRSITQSDEPPMGDEIAGLPICPDPGGHVWQKIHLSAPRMMRGPSWGGGKGFW